MGSIQVKLLSIFGVCFVLILPLEANAISGLDLYRACQSKQGSADEVGCLAYIRGYVEGLTMGHVLGEKFKGVMCVPKEGIPSDQARVIIEKHIKQNPEKLNLEAGFMLIEAFIQAFPCQR